MTTDDSKTDELEEITKEARSILRGETGNADELFELAKKLKKLNEFSLARRILARARRAPGFNDNHTDRIKIIQHHALCTYKDTDLPVDAKLDRAFEILKETGENLNETKDQETLGLAGAICKRKWEVDGRRQHLERSLSYYRRGYEQGVSNDYGYTGINAAFVLDLIANQEEADARDADSISKTAGPRREEAKAIREEIVSTLPGLLKQPHKMWLESEWWFLVTIAEAYFGFGQYNEAGKWLDKAKSLPNVSKWEFESTARQFAAIAHLQYERLDESLKEWINLEGSLGWQVLYEFLGDSAAGVRTSFTGKVGLALSGGGFRASLFHIGVLAQLAELDMLRHVEVISCVSGGSITGAHYYLEVRKLLQTKPDEEITREDYIEIVKRIEKDFLDGVQKNIRTKVAAEFKKNLNMIFCSDYSRTHRLGELYEKEIFAKVKDGEGNRDRWLNGLFIKPKDEPDDFRPKNDNWKRMAKVPILILNAATLNTGHNWQFTASWIGEPPAGINTEIDGNDYLRRMYYSEAPEKYQKMRLGYAVAASSCVPGLFEPLALPELYPDRTVRLVDGGVQDNQGVYALLEQDCKVFLVSDATGQSESQADPSAGTLGVPLRTLDILMARVREAQYKELSARRRSGLARGLMFVHLKKDLDVDPVDWIYCQDPYEASDEARPSERRGVLTCYGVLREVQKRLAAIRTDLDSFSDKEAYALMTSAYLMTKYEFPDAMEDFPAPKENEEPGWRFLAVEKEMNGDIGLENSQELMNLLEVAKSKAFKIWMLSPKLRILVKVLGFVALLSVFVGSYFLMSSPKPLLTVGFISKTIFWIILIYILGFIFKPIVLRTVMPFIQYRSTLTRTAIGIGTAILGYIAANIHLCIFDKWYLKRGRINKEKKT